MEFTSFNELGLSAPLVGVLSRLEITQPTEVQSKVIPLALAGQDIAASARRAQAKRPPFYCRLSNV